MKKAIFIYGTFSMLVSTLLFPVLCKEPPNSVEVMADEGHFEEGLPQDWQTIYKEEKAFYQKAANKTLDLLAMLKKKKEQTYAKSKRAAGNRKLVAKVAAHNLKINNTPEAKSQRGAAFQRMALNQRYNGNLIMQQMLFKKKRGRGLASVKDKKKAQVEAADFRRRVAITDQAKIAQRMRKKAGRGIASQKELSFFDKMIKKAKEVKVTVFKAIGLQ